MFDESKHPRAEDGRFTDGSGVGKTYRQNTSYSEILAGDKSATYRDRKAKVGAEDKTSIREQVQANIDKLKNTKVLVTISKSQINTDFKFLIEELKTKLAKNGGVVSRKGFGNVQVSSRLKQAGAYLKTAAEIAAVSSIPDIIKNGVLIDEHKSHKGRGYPTYTFAGKVSISGQEGIMAVVLKKTTGNFYKVHRVLTPDGQDLKIENDTD